MPQIPKMELGPVSPAPNPSLSHLCALCELCGDSFDGATPVSRCVGVCMNADVKEL
jgi:hypothetical protein